MIPAGGFENAEPRVGQATGMLGTLQFDVGEFRKRIQKMTDAELICFGKAARYMAEPKNSADKKTVESVYEIQLGECREEWRRRHPWEDVNLLSTHVVVNGPSKNGPGSDVTKTCWH